MTDGCTPPTVGQSAKGSVRPQISDGPGRSAAVEAGALHENTHACRWPAQESLRLRREDLTVLEVAPRQRILHRRLPAQWPECAQDKDAAARLAQRARDAGWIYDEFLVAAIFREVSAMTSGAELRIRAAAFPVRKSREGSTSTTSPRTSAPAPSSPRHRTAVLLGPPGSGNALSTGQA